MKNYQQPDCKSALAMLKLGVMQIEESETATVIVGDEELPPEEALSPQMKSLWDDDM